MKTQLYSVLLTLLFTLAAPLAAVSQCLTFATPPVACWKGEGTTNDLTGAYPASWVGTPAFAPGKVGAAFALDGTNNLRVADTNALSFTALGAAFTIEAWVNPTVWRGGILSKGANNTPEYSLWLNPTNNQVVFTMGLLDAANPLNPPQAYTVSGGTGASNQWQHVAGVYQSGSMAVFLNGLRVFTTALNPNLAAQNTTSQLILGRGAFPTQLLIGRLDEVCLFPSALPDATIQAIYANGSLGKCPPTNCVAPPSGLVAWWRAEGNATDTTGSYPGTAASGTTYAPGKVGQAFLFDQPLENVHIPYNAVLFGLAQGTVEMWVRIPDLSAPYALLLSLGKAGLPFGVAGQHEWSVNFNGGPLKALQVAAANGSTFTMEVRTGTNSLADTNWHHVAVVSDGVGMIDVFIDGVAQPLFAPPYPAGTVDSFFASVAGADYMRIHGVQRDVPFMDNGPASIDEVSIYSRPLSPTELQLLYAAGSYGKCAPASLDSDGDGLSDAYEIANGSNPYDPPSTGLDNDGDGLSNEAETGTYLTNPNLADTDGDGETDGMEVQMGTDPRDANSVLHIFPPTVLPGGARRICWTSQAGRTYELHCADLRTNGPGGAFIWITRTNITATSTLTCVDDQLGSVCAYRVRLMPSAGADTLAPVVGALQLVGYTPGAVTAALRVIARDIAGVTMVELLDGNTVLGSATRGSNDTWNFTWNLNVNLNGRHYLRARARDAAGNYGYSPTLVFDVSLAGGSCVDFGAVRICADSVTVNAGVYSFSGNIRINGIRLNVGATVTGSASGISGTGGVTVPGVGTVFSGTFDVDRTTGWLTVRPSPTPTYSTVAFNTRISVTPTFAAVNVFNGAIQGAGTATVQVPGHTYGSATFTGSFSFDPAAAKITVAGTLTMGSTFSGTGTAMLNLADSTFMLSGDARFLSANGDAYTVSNGVATLYYAAATPYIAVSGRLDLADDIRVDVQGTIFVTGAMSLTGSNGVGTVDGFQFTQASGTLTRPAGASAVITLNFNARLIHPSLSNYMVNGIIRSTGDIDIMGTGLATFQTNLTDVTIVARFNPLTCWLRGNYFANNISNAISGTLLTPSFLDPTTFRGIMRADGSVDITGTNGPYTAAKYGGNVPPMDAANLTLEERIFVGCYHLFSRNNSTTVNATLRLTRTSEASGGVVTLNATATATTPGQPTLTLSGTASSTGAASLTGTIAGQSTGIWGYSVANLSCTASRNPAGVFTFSITGGSLTYAGLSGSATQVTGSISSDGSGYIDFTYSSCTLNGYSLQNATFRLAQTAGGTRSLTVTATVTVPRVNLPGTGFLFTASFSVSGTLNSDGTYALTGTGGSSLALSGLPVTSINASVAGSVSLRNTGLTVTGATSGGVANQIVVVSGSATATLNVPANGQNVTISGCLTVEPLVFDQFRIESTQPQGRFLACFGPNGLTFPSNACVFYRGTRIAAPALPEFTISASGNFTINVTVAMTAGASLNEFNLPSLSFTLTRSGGVTFAQNVFADVSVPGRNPGFNATTTFFVYGTLNMDGTFELTGTGGSSLALFGTPIGTVNASAGGSVVFTDSFFTVDGSCSGGVLNTLPAGFSATATLTVTSSGVITLAGSVTCSALQSGVIFIEAVGGGNLAATLSNAGLGFSGAQVRVSGVFSAAIPLPGFTMAANGSFDFSVNAGSPSGFTIRGYGFTSISFTLNRNSSGTLSLDPIRADLNVPGFSQRLTGSITSGGTVTMDYYGSLTVGGFAIGAADGDLRLTSQGFLPGLYALGTLNVSLGAGSTGTTASFDVSILISPTGVISGAGTGSATIGGFGTGTFAIDVAANRLSGSATLNFDGKSVAIGNLVITTTSVSGSGSVDMDSGWQSFGAVNGRLAGAVSLSIASSGSVTASMSWTLAYWFDRFDCGIPPGMCPRPELNDSKLDGPPSQKATSSGSVDSEGRITVNHAFSGVSVTSWSFNL